MVEKHQMRETKRAPMETMKIYGQWQVMSGLVCEHLLVYVLKEKELAFQDVDVQAT